MQSNYKYAKTLFDLSLKNNVSSSSPSFLVSFISNIMLDVFDSMISIPYTAFPEALSFRYKYEPSPPAEPIIT